MWIVLSLVKYNERDRHRDETDRERDKTETDRQMGGDSGDLAPSWGRGWKKTFADLFSEKISILTHKISDDFVIVIDRFLSVFCLLPVYSV